MRFRGAAVPALLCVLALNSQLVPTVAQVVTGSVVDGETRAPIADVSVVLLDGAGRVQRGILTEVDGTFTLSAPAAGRYTIRCGAFGYETKDSPPLKLEKGTSHELTMVLYSEDRSWPPPDFYQRMNLGEGVFLTPEDIEARGGSRFTDLLRHLPGVQVVLYGRRDALGTPGVGGAMEYFTVRLRGLPVLFVDGIWWGSINDASDLGPDGAFAPGDIAAVEIYRHPSIVPEVFNIGRDIEGGVIVVWRRRSSAPDP